MPLREYYIGVYLEQVRVGLQSGMRPGFVRDETDRRAPSLKTKGVEGGTTKVRTVQAPRPKQRREPNEVG